MSEAVASIRIARELASQKTLASLLAGEIEGARRLGGVSPEEYLERCGFEIVEMDGFARTVRLEKHRIQVVVHYTADGEGFEVSVTPRLLPLPALDLKIAPSVSDRGDLARTQGSAE